MDELLSVRILGVILLMMTGWLLIRFWLDQPERRYLVLAGIFSILFLLPHALADPRYYIVPFVMTGFFTVYTRRQEQLMIAWYGIVSIVICLVILKYGWIW